MANLTAADLDFTITFDCDTKQVKYTDNLDYSTFNLVPTATIRGLGVGLNPLTSAIFLNKQSPADPLIANLDTGDKESAWYDLPTDSVTGEIVNGTYPFSYSVYVPYTAVNQAVTSFGASNTIVVAGVDWSYVLEAGDNFTVSGATTPANNGNKVVSSIIYNGSQTIITVTTAIVVEAGGSAVINWSQNVTLTTAKTQSFSGCNEVTPILTLTSDCTNGQYGSITASDTTTYGTQTIVDRTIQLEAPNGLFPEPPQDPWETTTASESALTVPQLATGTWTATLLADLSYTGIDGLVVTYSFSSPSNVFTSQVVCSTQMCDLYPCISNLITQVTGCNNPTQDQLVLMSRVNLSVNAAQIAQACGDTDALAAQIAILEGLLDGGCGCAGTSGSSDTSPQWVNNDSASGETTIIQLVTEMTNLTTEVNNLTTIINNYQQTSQLLFKATWAVSGDGSWGQIVPFTIPKEYFEIGSVAPYYESPAFAKMVIEFKVAQVTAQIILYNQTDGVAWATLNVGAMGVTGGRITMYWSSWNSLPACTMIAEYEDGTNGYTHDENNLTGIPADWDLTQDLLVNIIPNDIADISYSFVEVTGHRYVTPVS